MQGAQLPIRDVKASQPQQPKPGKSTADSGPKDSFKDLVNSALEDGKPTSGNADKTERPDQLPKPDNPEASQRPEESEETAETALQNRLMQAQLAISGAVAAANPQHTAVAGQEAQILKGGAVQVLSGTMDAATTAKTGTAQADQAAKSGGGLQTDAGSQQAKADARDSAQQAKTSAQQAALKAGQTMAQTPASEKATASKPEQTAANEGQTAQRTQSAKLAQQAQENGKTADGGAKLTEAGKTVSQTEQKSTQNGSLKQDGKQETAQTKARPQGEEAKTTDLPVTTQKVEKLDPGKVNIKVAEPYTANAESKQFAKQVAEKIIFSGTEGKNEIEIHLMPKDLGKITIKLIFEGNSALVQMTATNAKAQQVLNLNAESIRHIVENNTNTNVVVSVNEENKFNQREAFDGKGERQSKEQEPQKERDAMDEDAQIAFVNQLRLGLLERNVS